MNYEVLEFVKHCYKFHSHVKAYKGKHVGEGLGILLGKSHYQIN